MLVTFHFVNRVADLLAVPADVLPPRARRLEPVRRAVVRMMSLLLRRMDLRPRPYPVSFEAACAAIAPLAGGDPRAALAPLRPRPQLIEAIALMLEDRARSALDGATLARVEAAVEAALPRTGADVAGIHPRPADPVAAAAFVGTRYAARTTPAMIAALRACGLDDVRILDLAIAIGNANAWARLWRLAGLPAGFVSSAAAG